MKREHFLVAELYRYLAPFVDENQPIYLSLDGIAARRGVRENLLVDPDVPDLCFTLLDGREHRIEAKLTSDGKHVSAGRGQYDAWFGGGTGCHKPTGWVIADEPLARFYYCTHTDFAKQRTTPPRPSEHRYVSVSLPTMTPFASVRHLALHILGE